DQVSAHGLQDRTVSTAFPATLQRRGDIDVMARPRRYRLSTGAAAPRPRKRPGSFPEAAHGPPAGGVVDRDVGDARLAAVGLGGDADEADVGIPGVAVPAADHAADPVHAAAPGEQGGVPAGGRSDVDPFVVQTHRGRISNTGSISAAFSAPDPVRPPD